MNTRRSRGARGESPTDGHLWMVYGSCFGYIRLVELDPKTQAARTRLRIDFEPNAAG